IVPDPSWRGKRRITWTATEWRTLIPGTPALSTSDISDIVVNNPPRFNLPRGPAGVKRDTVRLVEDQHPFVSAAGTPDPRRAYRGQMLDDLVADPDIVNPITELNYAPLAIGANGNLNVRGGVDGATHQLLVWSAPDFAGVDSFRVLVQDQYRAQDTLRVIVEVEQVPDAPRFIVPADQRNPRVSRGSARRYDYASFLADADTPLDSLLLSWTDDPEKHFVGDTLRIAGRKTVEVRSDPTFTGTGRISFVVKDPADTVNLTDTMILFFEAAEALPPNVFPPEAKIDVSPGRTADPERLDDFVEDPDNEDAQLTWAIPSVTQSQLRLNESRVLSVSAPAGFVGYEAVTVTVSDPGNQSDDLLLRIYSSDGRPVTGGIPDVVLDRGGQDQKTDLDNYYYDLDNPDTEMLWRALETYDTRNLQVGIDPLTHIVTYFAPSDAVFRTETVVFRVTDPAGTSAEDTVLVTIRSGGVDPGADFSISPPLPALQAPVNQLVQVLDLSQHLVTSAAAPGSTITWSVTRSGRIGTAIVSSKGKVSVLGNESGLDTLEFTASDAIGRTKRASTTIRYVGAGESLELRAIPDILFIAGQPFQDLKLNDYILDRVTHPDSLVHWDYADVGTGDFAVLLRVSDDSSVLAVANDVGETQVVFVARNTKTGVTGRDTVRVIAQDPSVAARPLKDIPPLVIAAGSSDSSTVLNQYLPDGIPATKTNWSVSGQKITSPVISPVAPHRLKVQSVGTSIGVDSLRFSVDLGGGFRATGTLVVTVTEPITASTLGIRVVPNPINPDYLDFFVVARTQLASSPTVVVSFEGDTTIAVRQIEDQLSARGVLIWTGNTRLRPRATGTALFRAQALTALGSSVNAQASIAIATASAGKALAIVHGEARLDLPPGAVTQDVRLVLMAGSPEPEYPGEDAPAARRAGALAGTDPELELVATADLYPVALVLQRPGALVFALDEAPAPVDGVYRFADGRWAYLGPAASPVAIPALGQYAVMRDLRAPSLGRPSVAVDGHFSVAVADGGSGVDERHLVLTIGDQPYAGQLDGGVAIWLLPPEVLVLGGTAHLEARDRAGNVAEVSLDLDAAARGLPLEPVLGANYPNPFNPETTIPFAVPAAPGSAALRLVIYNLAGQTVRVLADGIPTPGRHAVVWDGRDEAGNRVGSGVYLYRLESRSGALTRQMLLLK
ncbi:MAG: FlgD immunoglobulin-like domain containing protein, partial [Gemmatimonadota bacterium]